jgi:hypothetical protein
MYVRKKKTAGFVFLTGYTKALAAPLSKLV